MGEGFNGGEFRICFFCVPHMFCFLYPTAIAGRRTHSQNDPRVEPCLIYHVILQSCSRALARYISWDYRPEFNFDNQNDLYLWELQVKNEYSSKTSKYCFWVQRYKFRIFFFENLYSDLLRNCMGSQLFVQLVPWKKPFSYFDCLLLLFFFYHWHKLQSKTKKDPLITSSVLL